MSGAVLAGGLSRRFGQPKATYVLNGKPMLLHTLDALLSVSREVMVVGRTDVPLPPLPSGVSFYADILTLRHPATGIATALHYATFPLVFVCAVDMPSLNPQLICAMYHMATDAVAAVIPCTNGRLQPLHAIYRRDFAGELLRRLQTIIVPSLHQLLKGLPIQIVPERCWRRFDPEGKSFCNVNTPRELVSTTDMELP